MGREALKLFDIAVENERIASIQVVSAEDLAKEVCIRDEVIRASPVSHVKVAEDHVAIPVAHATQGCALEELGEVVVAERVFLLYSAGHVLRFILRFRDCVEGLGAAGGGPATVSVPAPSVPAPSGKEFREMQVRK
jgi:hypothetical protein